MGRQRPRSVSVATGVQWTLVALGGVIVLLTILMRNDLVEAWARNNDAARVVLADGGMQALRDSSIRTPSFVPVAVVSFVVFALLAWVLLALFRSGHGWARVCLSALAAFSVLSFVVIYRQDPPLSFTLVGLVAVVLDVVLLFLLWHPDTTEFVRGAELAEEKRSTRS